MSSVDQAFSLPPFWNGLQALSNGPILSESLPYPLQVRPGDREVGDGQIAMGSGDDHHKAQAAISGLVQTIGRMIPCTDVAATVCERFLAALWIGETMSYLNPLAEALPSLSRS